jgi:hypothetical protein
MFNAAMQLRFRDSAISIGSPADGDLDINADDEIELNSTLIDVNGNLDVSGTGVIAGAVTTAALTASGIIKTDDTTAATSTTDGSLQTDGGLSVAADAVIGDDLFLLSDAAVQTFGADKDVTLTHVADTGLLLNAAMVVQFRDSAINIGSPADGDLDINADDEIELNSTLIDINGNVEISGTLAQADAITMATNKKIIFRDAAIHISSTADGDLAIAADDEIDLTSTLIDINGNVEISGTTAQVGVLTTTATQVATGGITSGSNIVSDTDSTDDLGTTGVRWANLFVDAITATDQITATGFTGTLDGILGSGAAAAATVTTLNTSGAVNLNLTTDSTSSTSGALIIDGGVGVAKKLFVGTDFDVSGNSVIDGTALVTGVATFGDDVVSDTDSTDDLGTTGVRWANLFVDAITATDQITATGFTGTLDGILGSGTAAAATTTTLASTTITASGIIKTDDTTAATSTTDGSLQTDGGLSVVLDAVIGDDLFLLSDAAAIKLGANSEVSLNHMHNTGIHLIGTTATNSYTEFKMTDGNAGYSLQVRSDAAVSIPTGSFVLNDLDTSSFPIVVAEGCPTATLALNGTGITVGNVGQYAATSGAALTVRRSGSNLRIGHFENTRNSNGDEILRTTIGSNCHNTTSFAFIHTTSGVGDTFVIFGNGNVVNQSNSYGQGSDIKIKQNITDATSKLDDLCNVRIRNFEMIADPTLKQIGVVAQELEPIFPNMIFESSDRDENDQPTGTTTKNVKYSVFVPMLIKGLQELRAKNDVLEDRIEILEAAIGMTVEGQLLDGTNGSSANAGGKVTLG